jgi:hypothetical protein
MGDIDGASFVTPQVWREVFVRDNGSMSISTALQVSLKQLAAALDHLEAAAERRAAGDATRADREEELAIIQKDRSRLAVELDGALARGSSLDRANQEAGRRLARAEASIRAVLGEDADERVDDKGE